MSTKFGLLIAVAAAILKNGYDVILLHISELNNYTGNLLTVVLHTIHTAARRIYSLAVEVADSI